jgi:arginase
VTAMRPTETRPPALAVIGNPSSAASYAAGQDQAPDALRAAGLLEALSAIGRTILDLGDLPRQIWYPDREQPFTQHAADIVDNLIQLRDRLTAALRDGHDLLLLGGNCTIALSAVAALRDVTGDAALLYIDRHFDCNTPASVTDGALDWMGIAHALGLPGTLPELRDAFGSAPLLTADRISFLGIDPAKATTWERRQADLNAFRYVTSAALHDDPVAAAETAVNWLPAAPLTVHIDVDVLDFTDAPLAEDTAGRNAGPTLDQLADAVDAATRPRGTKPDGARILSVGELNPTRAAGTPDALPRFVRFLTQATSTPAPNPSQ